jgi:hypothetical protein
MAMRHGSRPALLAALSLCAGAAAAQEPGAAPPPAPPQYEVEILVFAHRTFDPYEERFDLERTDTLRSPLETAREAPVFDESTFDEPAFGATVVPDPAAIEPDAPPLGEDPLLMRPLRADELKLGTEYRKLGAIAAYAPVLHAGWVQPGLPEGEARPFDLGVLGVFNPRGTVRVHLSRFLHVTLDLTYQGEAAVPEVGTPGELLGELAIAPRYRLATTRSVRSGELHYFDHPAFGVLVRITPRAAPGANTARRPAA